MITTKKRKSLKYYIKGYRNEIILFNLKQEEYIYWLYNNLKNGTYKHRRLYYILCDKA